MLMMLCGNKKNLAQGLQILLEYNETLRIISYNYIDKTTL